MLAIAHSQRLQLNDGSLGGAGRMRTRDIVTIAVLVIGSFAFVAWQNLQSHQAAAEAQAKNPKAIEAGFSDHKEMEKAAAEGITNGADWNAKLTKDHLAAVAAETARYEATRNPATKMSVENMTWSIGGFGSVGVVTLAINNSNDFPIKNVGIECQFSGKSGTRLSTVTHTIFDSLKGRSKRTFKGVNVGFINSRSARAGCSVETARYPPDLQPARPLPAPLEVGLKA